MRLKDMFCPCAHFVIAGNVDNREIMRPRIAVSKLLEQSGGSTATDNGMTQARKLIDHRAAEAAGYAGN